MQPSSWRPNFAVEAVTSWVRTRRSPKQTSTILAAILFLFYWLLPGIFCAFEGSLFSPQLIHSSLSRLSNLTGLAFWRPNFAFLFPNSSSDLLYYTDDLTHLLFTGCLVVEVYLGNLLFDRIESFTADLRRAGCQISHEDEVAIRALNQRFRKLFRSPGWLTLSLPRVVIRLFAAIAGVSVFLFFFSKVHQPCIVSAKCWWGQSGSGIAGTYYSLAIGGLVYLATEALAAILVGMSMINFILRDGYAKPESVCAGPGKRHVSGRRYGSDEFFYLACWSHRNFYCSSIRLFRGRGPDCNLGSHYRRHIIYTSGNSHSDVFGGAPDLRMQARATSENQHHVSFGSIRCHTFSS